MNRRSRRILDVRIDATSYDDATARILQWAEHRESRYVCVANVHMVMECHDSPEFQGVVNGADLVTPDGMPLVWMLRLLGVAGQSRVYGPDLMLHVCRAAAAAGVPVGFFGGSPEALAALTRNLERRYSGLRIAFSCSPPFRPATPEEDALTIARIDGSGARVLFIGLGCPKQERWMAAHRGRVRAVLVGVGAAFDFHAGRTKQAPKWMQRIGLEWAYRLTTEPRRLWKRYAVHNPRFVGLAGRQLLTRGKRT